MRVVENPAMETRWGWAKITFHIPERWRDWWKLFWMSGAQWHELGNGQKCKIEIAFPRIPTIVIDVAKAED